MPTRMTCEPVDNFVKKFGRTFFSEYLSLCFVCFFWVLNALILSYIMYLSI
jgi:hypothetical protein